LRNCPMTPKQSQYYSLYFFAKFAQFPLSRESNQKGDGRRSGIFNHSFVYDP
jgi:hypothetical protein